MSFMETQKKIEENVVGGYKKIEETVVGGYKKIEDTVVGGYKKIEDKFVEKFLPDDPRAKPEGPAAQPNADGEA